MSRYMTPLGKVQELESWAKAKADRIANPPAGFSGGHGWPDPEVYAHVDRLNKLRQLCTLQSCAGHRCTKELHCESCAHDWAQTGFWPGDGGQFAEPVQHVWNGQLWLWPDERMAGYVYHNAVHLASLQGVEKCGVLWHVEGREIIDLQFRGAGHGELDKSMAAIALFFEEAAWRCNL
jgi:hypothetical protein